MYRVGKMPEGLVWLAIVVGDNDDDDIADGAEACLIPSEARKLGKLLLQYADDCEPIFEAVNSAGGDG